MKLSNLMENHLAEQPERPFDLPITHPDEVQAHIFKSGEEWSLNVVLSNFIPEVRARYTDFSTAVKAVEDLETLGILVKGTRTPEWEAEVARIEAQGQADETERNT
ncbi:MAG: hypothetical protein Q8K86_07215 [Candidatus Nanopelagicaceae bacterium]|nr:hypothetical protein [Candidatus Nanopelagicaceae bacterium]